MTKEQIEQQKAVCSKYGVPWVEAPEDLKIGVSKNLKNGILPINGLRHPPVGVTTGWYIWAGTEFSTEKDFFLPIHVKHLDDWYPGLIKFLGLPPGWRFLTAGDYEDVWEDAQLLEI